jgi:hypothetical protein
MVAYGGVDALIWLCRSSKSIKVHHLTTTILAMLAEKGKKLDTRVKVILWLKYFKRIHSTCHYHEMGFTSFTSSD